MKFPYIRYNVFYKPVIPVIFEKNNKRYSYQALIDTGSDVSIIHFEMARELGINIKKCQKYYFGGIGGKGEGYICHINMIIGGYVIEDVPVVFSDSLADFSFGILGHEGLFDKLKLVFELNKRQFEIIPKEYKKKLK